MSSPASKGLAGRKQMPPCELCCQQGAGKLSGKEGTVWEFSAGQLVTTVPSRRWCHTCLACWGFDFGVPARHSTWSEITCSWRMPGAVCRETMHPPPSWRPAAGFRTGVRLLAQLYALVMPQKGSPCCGRHLSLSLMWCPQAGGQDMPGTNAPCCRARACRGNGRVPTRLMCCERHA